MDLEVRRDDAKGKYYAVIDGHEAHIRFAPAGDRVLDFQHTEVPRELRGRGVADTLVRRALLDVRARGERIVPTCPFVKAFLGKHPEYQALAATTG
ncbi:MAG TPA: GNAT family N-acetyltransferase [Thermoanaerobaculia bacterium]|nr:GNAT family N-acetyltransferase [Thermoanaerobaculia bacterium]